MLSVERGVRQGDPLSPCVFTLAVEIFSSANQQNDNIKGIKLNNTKVKVPSICILLIRFITGHKFGQTFLKTVHEFDKLSVIETLMDRVKHMQPLGISW